MRQIVLISMLVTAVVPCASATVVLPADLGELTRDARTIARGVVVAVDARWTDDRRTIETIVTLQPETYLKGESRESLTFRVPGGTLGRYQNMVIGAPRFEVGQRVIVFLGSHGPTVPYLLGLSQGVFRVARSVDGAWMVTPPSVAPSPVGPVVRGSTARQPAPLATFERDVRALVAGAR